MTKYDEKFIWLDEASDISEEAWQHLRPASGQSLRHSILETVVSTSVGYALSSGLMFFLAWAYGLRSSPATNFQVVFWFTLLSLLRSFVLRRIFNHLHLRSTK